MEKSPFLQKRIYDISLHIQSKLDPFDRVRRETPGTTLLYTGRRIQTMQCQKKKHVLVYLLHLPSLKTRRLSMLSERIYPTKFRVNPSEIKLDVIKCKIYYKTNVVDLGKRPEDVHAL